MKSLWLFHFSHTKKKSMCDCKDSTLTLLKRRIKDEREFLSTLNAIMVGENTSISDPGSTMNWSAQGGPTGQTDGAQLKQLLSFIDESTKQWLDVLVALSRHEAVSPLTAAHTVLLFTQWMEHFQSHVEPRLKSLWEPVALTPPKEAGFDHTTIKQRFDHLLAASEQKAGRPMLAWILRCCCAAAIEMMQDSTLCFMTRMHYWLPAGMITGCTEERKVALDLLRRMCDGQPTAWTATCRAQNATPDVSATMQQEMVDASQSLLAKAQEMFPSAVSADGIKEAAPLQTALPQPKTNSPVWACAMQEQGGMRVVTMLLRWFCAPTEKVLRQRMMRALI